MSGKWRVDAPEYVKGGRKKVLTAADRAELLGEAAPNIKREDPADINFQCKWQDVEKQERYDRYCKNTKDGKLDPYAGLAPDDLNPFDIAKEKAEFERAATQKSAVSAIMMNRFKRAEFMDRDENVSLPQSHFEKKFQEKRDAVAMNFFGAMTHELYDWYPAKLLCRRFDVPEPYPGSSQVGCPYIEMLNAKTGDQAEGEVQGIFGASRDEMSLFQTEKPSEPGAPTQIAITAPVAICAPVAPIAAPVGLASAADLLKMEENQFKTASEVVAQMRPQKSLAEIKREMLTKINGQADKPKYVINPIPTPGTVESKLPSTVKTIVRETNFGNVSRPLSKQPSRFSSNATPQPTESRATTLVPTDPANVSARKMRLQQRQQKVKEQLSTVAADEKPPVDVFKSIFSDSESDEDDKEDSDDSEDENDTLTIQKAAIKAPEKPGPSEETGDKKLSWNRFSQPLKPNGQTKSEPVEEPLNTVDEPMDTDAMDPPKFTFTVKKDRKTTKKEPKIEKPDSDSGKFLYTVLNFDIPVRTRYGYWSYDSTKFSN